MCSRVRSNTVFTEYQEILQSSKPNSPLARSIIVRYVKNFSNLSNSKTQLVWRASGSKQMLQTFRSYYASIQEAPKVRSWRFWNSLLHHTGHTVKDSLLVSVENKNFHQLKNLIFLNEWTFLILYGQHVVWFRFFTSDSFLLKTESFKSQDL